MDHDPRPSDLARTLDRVLEIAKATAPDAEALVQVEASRDANTRFARNEITTDGDVDETEVHVRLVVGQRHAEATTNQTDDASLRAVVERALAMVRLAPPDPESMPVLGPQRYVSSPPCFDPATAALGAAERAAAAHAAIAAAEAGSLRAAGYYEHSARTTALKTSAGLYAEHAQTSASLTVTARTLDPGGSGWGMALSHRASEIDPGQIARVATQKALASARPQPLDPGRYTVVLEPAAVGELLGFFSSSLDARSADEGRSFFSRPGGGTKLGEKLFADSVTLRSDPTDAGTPGAPFDGDGFPLAPTTWVDRGTLTNLSYSRYWARKQSRPPTGDHAVVQLSGGSAASQEELVRGVKRGLLITRFWYTRWVDHQSMLITGLTRDGVFLIEDGQITRPVNNFRFNESPVAMLRNVEAMTQKTVRAGRLRVPALRTAEFNLASRSDAV
jgi:predicted Zn-dependent protease